MAQHNQTRINAPALTVIEYLEGNVTPDHSKAYAKTLQGSPKQNKSICCGFFSGYSKPKGLLKLVHDITVVSSDDQAKPFHNQPSFG